jgi:mannose-6-phosphate isomerase-like protein (cupin superfamily)
MSADRQPGLSPDPATSLRSQGFDPGSWSNGPHDRYGAHDHPYDKVLVVESGSIRFGLPDLDRSVELAIGDRLDLPAHTRHDAVVGGSGVTCLEAHVPAGTFAAATFRGRGDW